MKYTGIATSLLLCSTHHRLAMALFQEEELWRLELAEILVDYKNDPKPLIVVDLDDTVALIGEGIAGVFRFGFLFLGFIGIPFFSNAFVPPIAKSSEILNALANDWHLAYITARPSGLAEASLEWLDLYNFPRAPLFTGSDFFTLIASQGLIDYKSSAVRHLQDQGFTVEYGIGDKSTDIKAWTDRGLKGILILSGYTDGDLASTLEILGPSKLDITSNTSLAGLEFIAFNHDTA